MKKSKQKTAPVAADARSVGAYKRAGTLIRLKREQAGLSLRQFSDAIKYEHFQFVSRIELGYAALPRHLIAPVCKVLNVSADELITAMADDHYDAIMREYLAATGGTIAPPPRRVVAPVAHPQPSPPTVRRTTNSNSSSSKLRLFRRAG